MGKLLVLNAPGEIAYQDYEDAPLSPDEVRIKTLYSGISAGTELSYYRGTNPYLSRQWDSEKRLFLESDSTSYSYPVKNLGYEEVGEVVELGADVKDIPLGAKIFGTWGHRTLHVANLEYLRPRLMPSNAEPIFGIFSHLGAIALNGVHDAEIRLGDTVAIFGMGALGQIVSIMAQKSGGKVIAVDLHEARLEKAKELGAAYTLNASEEKVAERIKDITRGLGADVTIELTGSSQALNEAIRSTAYASRCVAMGFFQGEAKGLFLGEEFHHNRINLVCSQISGVAPALQHRWNKMRLWQTAIRLQAEGTIDLRPIISHYLPFEEAAAIYQKLDKHPQEVLHAVLEF